LVVIVDRTALHYAVTTENLPVFNVLLADGSSNLELPDGDGSTALWLALNKSSVDVGDNVYAAKLVSCGGSTNAVITKSGTFYR
jgi:ankyrin repeat protein